MTLRKLTALALSAIFAVLLTLEADAQANTVGKEAQDFTLTTHDGKTLTLSKLKGKRGAILVFFATWCPACMQEVPAVKALVEAAKGKNLLVYGVNVQQTKRIVDKFVSDHKVNYRVLLDANATVANNYAVRGIPLIVGIDGGGVVQYREHGLPQDTTGLMNKLTKGTE